MSNSFVLDIEPKIYTLIKAKCFKELKTKYPKIVFTTSDEISEVATFPNVYICETSSKERSRDLIGNQINSVESVFEIKVTVDTDKQDVSKIMAYLLDAFKQLRFEFVSKSKVITDANMFYQSATFRHTFGSDDAIN